MTEQSGPEFADTTNVHLDCRSKNGDNFDFAQGTITGLRTWSINPGRGTLYGVSHSEYVWAPGVNTCECGGWASYATFYVPPLTGGTINQRFGPFWSGGVSPTSNAKPGRCLRKTCGCGFWAYHNGSIYPHGNIAGVISAWGKTTIGSKGFRSEYAKILALYVPKRWKLPRLSKWRAILYYTSLVYLATAFCLNLALGNFLMAAVDAVALTVSGALFVILCYGSHDWSFSMLSANGVRELKRNYPDVKFYNDYDKMVHDFPPSYTKDEVT